MKITLIRNATLYLHYGHSTFLIDPFLAAKGTYPPFPHTANQHLNNPIVELPVNIDLDSLLHPDAVLLTHLHVDHFDDEAKRKLAQDGPIYTQSEKDRKEVEEAGFQHVTCIEDEMDICGVHIKRTGGQHGTGETAKRMGQVSGFVFSHPDEPTLYIAGDTARCDEPKEVVNTCKPDVIVVNSGAAQFLEGDPITMTKEEILDVHRSQPKAQIVACHLGAVNHCLLTRAALEAYIQEHHADQAISVPQDGESLTF
ncbi:MBL fold metallo-hydrolase [Bacillus safensis]|uniref:MBL fold metallo-hydrolase n=1 Tax=Bacillus TaxID=1386 RepID=UPI001C24A357|nr:MBL fold metallo-hydrolase [Bacillus safensis]MBU8606075.1 MBL fold metallo-hydrolase [Bacillus safensis]MBU8617595.1 MBL fold metallo-hydrolase [Bacillus safensis]MBU8628723.1 MBL fold metallo-hydrolase [Bacillus safensis]MCY7523372.1 MBL fold metallo-hydrolase [Bacillus safensis]MDF1460917.1 MBL fold metallo-hydrolase [Bacillus safensis]